MQPQEQSHFARSERIAWFAGGAVAALVLGTVLGPALAAPASPPTAPNPSPVPSPALLLPAQGGGTTNNGGQSQANPVRPIPMSASGVTGDSNNRMIAVTGNDITGQSVLYLVDTVGYHLAVYQASGGAEGTQSLKLVGGRNISLDLQLDGFNDKTTVEGQSLTFQELERRFSKDVPDER